MPRREALSWFYMGQAKQLRLEPFQMKPYGDKVLRIV